MKQNSFENAGSVVIFDEELVKNEWGYQGILQLLKEKGAPVLGVVYLEFDPNYDIIRERLDRKDVFYWSKK